jgi:hypothetical protein
MGSVRRGRRQCWWRRQWRGWHWLGWRRRRRRATYRRGRGGRAVRATRRPRRRLRLRLAVVPLRRDVHRHCRLLLRDVRRRCRLPRGVEGHDVSVAHRQHRRREPPQQRFVAGDLQLHADDQISRPLRPVGSSADRGDSADRPRRLAAATGAPQDPGRHEQVERARSRRQWAHRRRKQPVLVAAERDKIQAYAAAVPRPANATQCGGGWLPQQLHLNTRLSSSPACLGVRGWTVEEYNVLSLSLSLSSFS